MPVYSFTVTFLLLSLIMLLRYFILVGAAHFFSQKFPGRRIEDTFAPKEHILRDIMWSIVSTFVFALSGTVLIRMWQSGVIDVYLDFSKYGFIYLILSLPVLMFFHDMYFYWTHKLLHLKFFYKHVHLIHHRSRVPTAWTAFSFHPLEAIIQAFILPFLLYLFPVHLLILVIFLTLMTILGIVNHLGYEFYPEAFHRKPLSFMISATHHQSHHKNPNVNFGLYFNWWDLWMSTELKK